MLYEFRVNHRQFKAGDPVPASYPDGVIQTMLYSHRIREVVSGDAPQPRRRRGRAVHTDGRDSANG